MTTKYDVGDSVITLVSKKSLNSWGDFSNIDIVENTELEIQEILITKSSIKYLCTNNETALEAYYTKSEIELAPIKKLKLKFY